MIPRTLTPELEAALDGARKTRALASNEEAAVHLILADGIPPEEKERRRKILNEMRTMYPDLQGLSYSPKEKEAIFEGMDG